jgi:hypothetical protein
MSSFGVFTRQAQRLGVVVALLVATVIPTLVPALAAAAQVTERSIALSSSSKSATGVSYTANFTAAGAAGAFIIDFCNDSPVIGQTCTAPTGFNASGAASTTSGFTAVTGSTSQVKVVGTINASDNVSVVLTGINNPTVAGPLYARIVTFDTEAHADDYTSTTPGANVVDQGGVAISITDTVGVSGAVLESMTFCAANAVITADCANASSNAPVLKLGETVGSTVALDATHVSTGDIYTQISTNAVGGAIVSLKSGTTCGGLKRVEASVCDIAPAVTGGISAGDAKFGVKATAATDTGTNPNGTFQATNGYGSSTFLLNWVSGNATGVGSTYGDPILNTNSAPANNKNMKLTFGASINNSTPAGLYSTDLSLVATGKF